ncbi:MAG: leucine-rich repeat protein [Clostridia bacterium]|nr:leucine-rich repeat protein [Clostridia bacterium]
MKGKRLLCLFTICCLLLTPFHGVVAADTNTDTSWVEARNRVRYRGTAITEAERDYYSKITTCADKKVAELAAEITAGLSDDTTRLLAIYDWVRENIAYDSEHVARALCACMDPDLPDDALKQGKSHAAGIARLTEQLCRAAGIPAQAVSGYRLEPGESWGTKHQMLDGVGNHWWNEAYVDGHWAIFDVVNDTFDTPADSFFQTHLKLGLISDGTNLYTQKFMFGDGTISFYRPLDKRITAIEIPAQVMGLTVSEIGDRAFDGCSELTRITLSPTVTKVGSYAFAGTALEEAPDLSAVTEGAIGLFQGCTNLKSVTFPEHWTVVAAGMFQGCTALEEVTLPAGVQQIQQQAFQGCAALTRLELPANVGTVGQQAFGGSGITAVHLPDTVTTLGYRVFSDCQNLKDVTLSAGLTTIPRGAFRNCTALETIAVPAGVTTVEREAFEGCTALATLSLPEGLTAIEEAAFKGCGVLAELTLPEGLTELGKQAFSGCSGLTKLTLPSTFTTMGHRALAGLTALQEVQVAKGNEVYLAEDGVLFAANPRTLLLYPPARPNTSYTIPADVKKIAGSAFAGVTQLETVQVNASILLHDGWDGGYTFQDCTSLRRVDFASGTRVLPEGGFMGCTALTEVNLPSTLTTLSLGDFAGCTALESITVPASVRNFGGASKEALPALQGVQVDKNNKALGEIDGVIYQKTDNRLLWYPPARTDTSYEVPATITVIGKSAFQDASSLAAIILPEGLKKIDERAFCGSSLTSIQLPQSLTYMSSTALRDTPWWEAQPEGPVYCGDVFYGIKGEFQEKELVIREGTRLMAYDGLAYRETLKRLIIPASVTEIWTEAIAPLSMTWIVGERGSMAETYARRGKCRFVDLDELTPGDTDGDGEITTTDARLALQYAVGKADEYDMFLAVADVDGDGAYTTTDARLMLQYAVGKIDAFPAS